MTSWFVETFPDELVSEMLDPQEELRTNTTPL
jgi:hypothetical protein